MARPIPVIAAVADITTLPTATTLLDGSGSLPSGGASAITGYLWAIIDKPTGSAAYLSDETTATPTLHDVDIEGTYIIFLIVTDDAGRSSFGTPYALQHLPPEDLTTFDVPLYAFESPVAGSFVPVRAPYASGAARLNQSLYKTGRGEYGWLATGLWPLTELLSDLRGEMLDIYDAPNKTLQADAVAPQTPGAGVEVDGLTIKDTGSIVTLDSNRPTIRSLDDFSVAAGKTLRVEATGTARFDDVASTSGGDITSTSAIAAPEIKTPLVTSTTNIEVTSAGNLTLEATGGDITLTPATATQSVKPVFAPGLVQARAAEIPVIADTSTEAPFLTFVVTRHAFGSLVTIRVEAWYLIGGTDHACGLFIKVQSTGAAAAYIPLAMVGGVKARGRCSGTFTIPIVPAVKWVACHVMEKDGSSPATITGDFAALSALDLTNDLTVALVVIPGAMNTWDNECVLIGSVAVSVVNPTGEAVL